MEIKLIWNNINKKPAKVDIYRNTSIVTSGDLTDPIVTGLDAADRQYSDTTATYGIQYYYTFRTYNEEGEELFSTPKPIRAVFNSGPGGQTILKGNANLGYMGEVSWTEIGSANDISNSIGYGNVSATQATPTTWDKFIRKGKILFVPRDHLFSGTWQQAYAAGCVFGTDTVGPPEVPEVFPRVIQNARHRKNGFTFKVRFPAAIGDEHNFYCPLATTQLNTPDIYPYRLGCEAMDILFPLVALIYPVYQGLPNVQEIPASSFSLTPSSTIVSDGRVAYTTESFVTETLSMSLRVITTNTGVNVRPVLELENTFDLGAI